MGKLGLHFFRVVFFFPLFQISNEIDSFTHYTITTVELWYTPTRTKK